MWSRSARCAWTTPQQVRPPRCRPAPRSQGPHPVQLGSAIQIGPAVFDSRTGSLLQLGMIPVLASPRLDLWRAPTDNDQRGGPQALEPVERIAADDGRPGQVQPAER